MPNWDQAVEWNEQVLVRIHLMKEKKRLDETMACAKEPYSTQHDVLKSAWKATNDILIT